MSLQYCLLENLTLYWHFFIVFFFFSSDQNVQFYGGSIFRLYVCLESELPIELKILMSEKFLSK